MSEPTLQDCINYMRSQIKQMEKHPRNYEFNLPYYRKTVELLEKAQRPHGEWIPFEWDDKYSTKIPLPKGSDSHMEEYWDEEFMCSVCGKAHHARNFCPNCGADMREGDEK